MGSYTNVFGGETVNPAQLSYIAYTIEDDLVLVWPLEAPPDALVVADKIDIATDDTGLSVYLPPADQASVGIDVLIRNTGSDTFSVLDSTGGALGTIASGEAWYFVLKTNATAAGTWYAIEFGAATSSANAADLAGFGLRANVTELDQNLVTIPLLADYAITASDRASVLQNGTGAAAYTFASAVTLGNGFFVYIINAGSGNLTLTPNGAQTIDGGASKVLAPTESAIIFSDGSNLRSLGYGRSLVNTVTGASINIAGTGTATLSSSDVAAQVQDYTGLLTGNRIVDYGAVIGYWFVNNNTTGAFSLTARSGGLDAGVAITQGSFTILRSNGANMEIAFSDAGGTVTSVATTADLTGGPITTTGTLGLSNTTVTPGAYGSASETLTATVDAKGRVTAMADAAIAIALSQVSVFSSADLRGRLTDETGTGLTVFNDSPSLTTPTMSAPIITGNGTAVTQAATDDSTRLATTAFVFDWAANSPALAGTPTAPTAAASTDSTQIATTAFVNNYLAAPVYYTDATYRTITPGADLPTADTAPTSGEGGLVVSGAFTAVNASRRIRVTGDVFVVASSGATWQTGLFLLIDGTAVRYNLTVGGGAASSHMTLLWEGVLAAGAHTYALYVGSVPNQALYLNGNSTNRVGGGTIASMMSIQELPTT